MCLKIGKRKSTKISILPIDYENMLSVRMEDECACIETRNQKKLKWYWMHTHIRYCSMNSKKSLNCEKTFLHLFHIVKPSTAELPLQSFVSSAIAVFRIAIYIVEMCETDCGAACEKDWILIELWVDLNEQSRSFSSHHFGVGSMKFKCVQHIVCI